MVTSTNMKGSRSPNPVSAYFRVTRGAWYGFLFALPVLVGYELLEFVFQPNYANGADVLLKSLLLALEPQHRLLAFLTAIVLAGIACWWLDGSRQRAQAQGFQPRFFIGMLTESLVYALFLGEVVTRIIALLGGTWPLQIGLAAGGPLYNLTMALGAGIYEELLFRVIVMGLMMLVLHRALGIEWLVSWVLAVLGSSLLFSLAHHIGLGSEAFSVDRFIYRFVAGGVLATLYATRGFGVAVWTHALYDLLVMFHG